MSGSDMTDRPLLSQLDMSELRRYSRAQIFTALGTFDDGALARDAFVDNALDLLDPARVPGLGAARAAGDAGGALDAMMSACERVADSVPACLTVLPTTSDIWPSQTKSICTTCTRRYSTNWA